MFMKQYVIDELRPTDYEKIKAYLNKNFEISEVEHLYWIGLHEDLLSEVQLAHGECHPYFLAVELKPERLCCELLVRTKNRVKCSCMAYATEKQRNWFIGQVDAVFEKLAIQT